MPIQWNGHHSFLNQCLLLSLVWHDPQLTQFDGHWADACIIKPICRYSLPRNYLDELSWGFIDLVRQLYSFRHHWLGKPLEFFFLYLIKLFTTLKSLINEQEGYVVFLVLKSEYFIRDFRVSVRKLHTLKMASNGPATIILHDNLEK